MRYFTKDLWQKMNDADNLVRLQAEKEWDINSKSYEKQFSDVSQKLPQHFLKSFLSRNGLHDYSILGISIIKTKKVYSCELRLSNGEETVLIIMNGIKSLHIDLDSFLCCLQGNLTWGYSEFEIVAKKYVKLSVLCDIHNELEFVFKTIKVDCPRKKSLLLSLFSKTR